MSLSRRREVFSFDRSIIDVELEWECAVKRGQS